MATKRDSPYLWVTWLTKLLAGEQSCEFRTWFKAHFKDFEKREQEGDLANWLARHTEIIHKRTAELRAEGYTVYLEDQNKFTLKGIAITLQGKPDIVAVKDDDYVVIDAKGGKKRASDEMQVLIYMLAMPMTHELCKGKPVRGEIQYTDERVLVDVLPGRVRTFITETIRRIAEPVRAATAPSYQECRFCELTRKDCPSRIETEKREAVKTELF
jgi:hypothetical protein